MDWNPVAVQVPGMPVMAEQSAAPARGMVEVPSYRPLEFREDGFIDVNEMALWSVAVPVTKFSVSLDVMLKYPDTGVLPSVPVMTPPSLTPVHWIVP